MKKTCELLAAVPPGPLPGDVGLDHALAACWDGLRGSNAGGMEGYKLIGRMENIRWEPPILSFVIERHDGLGVGSTRAELQHWEVNLGERTACIVKEGYRQLAPMAHRISIKGMADVVTRLIICGKTDPRICRQDDGTVEIVLSKVLPRQSAYRMTTRTRRLRLVECVAGQLAQKGWVKVGGDGFRRR